MILAGNFSGHFMDRIGKTDADCAHGCTSRDARKSRGVITAMPNREACLKSATFQVTIAAFALTASSRTKSSSGSFNTGLQRKKTLFSTALEQRKSMTSSISSADSEVMPRFRTASYSETSGVDTCRVKIPCSTSESRRNEAPRDDLSAATRTFVSITISKPIMVLYVIPKICQGKKRSGSPFPILKSSNRSLNKTVGNRPGDKAARMGQRLTVV